jgi:hypothetical protein
MSWKLYSVSKKKKSSALSKIIFNEKKDIGGYPVILGDTAGIHTTHDPIELMGIALAKER